MDKYYGYFYCCDECLRNLPDRDEIEIITIGLIPHSTVCDICYEDHATHKCQHVGKTYVDYETLIDWETLANIVDKLPMPTQIMHSNDMEEKLTYMEELIYQAYGVPVERPVEETTKTVTVLLGNSDDKLTQVSYAMYCEYVQRSIQDHAHVMHFEGWSLPNSIYQNACFVFEIFPHKVLELKARLGDIRALYHQDSLAWVDGETTFI
jgi:hypothetical protein